MIFKLLFILYLDEILFILIKLNIYIYNMYLLKYILLIIYDI